MWIASSPLLARLNIRVGNQKTILRLSTVFIFEFYSEHCSEQRGVDLRNLM